MKKLLFAGLLVLVSLVGVRSQDLPKGAWQIEPSYPEFVEDAGRGHWEVSQVKVVWGDDSNLFAGFDQDGAVTDMTFHPNQGTVKAEPFVFPVSTDDTKSWGFPALEQWKKFAGEARGRCRFLTKHIYVNTVAYECVGKSRVLRDWEFGRGTEHLIFKDGDRLVVVSLDDWEGTEPKKGEKVLLGRHKVHDTFFPVEKVGEKYLIEPRTTEAFAEKDRDREEEAAKFEKLPIQTLPPIVVEGKLPDKEK